MGGGTTRNKKGKGIFKDYVSWFEIPAVNFQQSVDFYNYIYGIEMETNFDGNYAMAFFPANEGIGGAIVSGPGSTPSDTGPLLYLNGGKDLNIILKKVEKAGGRIIMPKTLINEEAGYFAIFIDSEGNKLALHSKK
ncbi:VOC family protein [Salinimicrobium flavum]|uniref:VOC family protein n=1 Tax=Salinimicrobium flavum TaxID=1737065 RepID=A0ABW5IZH1_9FLAO